MLFISCFVLLISEFKNTVTVSTFAPPVEGKSKVAIDLSLKSETQCPASYSRSLLFVSTVDGRLTCINAKNGKGLWSFETNEPLLSSSISSIKSGADLSKAHFIPSLDGTLFKWNGQYVESMALSTDFLLGQMKKLPDGSFVVGGTNVAIYGIDMDTGKILYESSGRGCKPTRKGKIHNKDVISLRRSQHVVRAVNRANGHENWNYSVGKYEMELAEDDLELNMNTLCDGDSIDLQFSVQEGIISNAGTSSWSFKLSSPIADAWQLENNSLKPVDIFKYGLIENVEGFSQTDSQSFMYLGVHEGQMYIQKPSGYVNAKTRLNPYDKRAQLQIDVSQWRPFISTSSSRTPTLNNKRLTALSTLDYPFDNGFVLISNITPTAMSITHEEEKSRKEDEPEGFCDIYGKNCEFVKPHVTPAPPPLTESVPLKDRWKEILVLSIFIAVGINLFVKFIYKKFRDGNEKTLLPFEDPIVAKEEVTDSDISELKINKRKKAASVSKPEHTKTGSDGSSNVSTGYDSRYIDDFEHVECLGKGGFGVVFKARKKIDDCEYAIKRIFLPHCEEAKSKMMREVKALAALEHPGIVRYFHAWWEEPPQDWQKTTDKTYLMKDYLNTTSYGLSQDWVLEVDGGSDGNSQSKLTISRPEKRKSDDPLGKRFNFDTGIEEIISDHREFDLLKHNDVFYPDDEEISIVFSSEKDIKDANEDSFDIVFESNCTSDNNTTQSFVHVSDDIDKSRTSSTFDESSRRKTLTELDDTEIDIENSDNSPTEFRRQSSRKGRTKKRLVGKCCAQNSLCLTQPPLFLYIQMQLCKQETLKDWLKNKVDGIRLVESMGIFMQIVDAVEYFHNLGLMHRDLKPANILFALDGHVKVGDFGLVTAITRPSIGKHHGCSLEDENHTGQVGTQLYMSPEQASGKPYCHKVDVYSLGLIFFELICSFSTQMERMQVIYRLKQGIISDDLLCTPQGKLVQILTAENPDLRPEAREIKNHILMTEINNNISNDVIDISDDNINTPRENPRHTSLSVGS